jgi:hypothetical protein
MNKTELVIQLLKIAIGIAFAAYFLWWSLAVLQRLSSPLFLLCHKFRYLFRAAQHGHRDSIVARAATNLRRIVAIEL